MTTYSKPSILIARSKTLNEPRSFASLISKSRQEEFSTSADLIKFFFTSLTLIETMSSRKLCN